QFPQNRQGTPLGAVKFTIRAEKCPNRRGVEEILKHFQGDVLGIDRLMDGLAGVDALYLTAAYPPRLGAWLGEEAATSLGEVPFFAALVNGLGEFGVKLGH